MLSALTEWGVSIHCVCRKLGKIWKLAQGKFEVSCYREKKIRNHQIRGNKSINFQSPLLKMI